MGQYPWPTKKQIAAKARTKLNQEAVRIPKMPEYSDPRLEVVDPTEFPPETDYVIPAAVLPPEVNIRGHQLGYI